MFIQLKNHKAHIYEHNKSNKLASNIFIIHGAGMDHRIGLMIDLSRFYASHNIYSIDLPGHGFTSGSILHTVEEMASYVSEIINEMNANNNIFIGHSMGGLVALELNLITNSELTILMNTNYPLLVGEILLQHAKGNLDQASEFFTKYGLYNIPLTKVKAKTFGSMGSGFYGRGKGTIQSPYGTKNIESDPQREIDVYPLKKLFNQTQKEILSYDLKTCSLYQTDKLQDLNNLKFIYGGKDKLARYSKDLEIHSYFGEETVYIMENTGHFPYFERPKELSKTLEDIISDIHV
tara:strand:- start:565 stop:1440 length:876 start_codon:yes stop_codon:yes gene_type:complete